ncbi:uncharacterized protein LOC111705776 [Eurytemora carolleeae]|uniref:uncharacterized protein LOC111705776 n=1 Tax=Eurytemora carolleeae TaxID=1294199 RepID=UPI000C7882FA|nr:uncharacterized protein LOC111705776 [Eurytemora carolleeae]|eukprot:XP_023334208.1 uncharacterized protein LOC111705776 [Eurytemora affinis]
MCGWLAMIIRQKAFVLFLGCVLLTSLFMILIPARRHRSLKTLVQETQDTILNLRENIISAGENLDTGRVSLQPDSQYLTQLGLVPSSYSSNSEENTDELLVVSGVEPGTANLVPGFVRSLAQHQPDASILIYDLGASRYEKELMNKICNSSLCTITEFEFSLWPNHVKDFKLKAYRPIGVQLALKEKNLVLWLDIDYRLNTNDLSSWLRKVKEYGVVAWSQDPLTKDGLKSEKLGATPTTSLTHPRMFEYFPHVKKEDFEFQHMVSGECLLFSSVFPSSSPSPSPSSLSPLASGLILPWIKCVLIEDCINPIGAQSTGCRFDKKPQYRYSGCHSYDVSALNIVLGSMFQFRESRYLSQVPFFQRINLEESIQSSPYLNISDYGLA